ncbi:hypothetical protein MKK88_15355 [Methylobacterium sp. E-005]|nr:hypothetical protein [Methylobacterium sp. E-005]MCJ2087351.1 hypothetical protein [Methylobacterium sp. E-005]
MADIGAFLAAGADINVNAPAGVESSTPVSGAADILPDRTAATSPGLRG